METTLTIMVMVPRQREIAALPRMPKRNPRFHLETMDIGYFIRIKSLGARGWADHLCGRRGRRERSGI